MPTLFSKLPKRHKRNSETNLDQAEAHYVISENKRQDEFNTSICEQQQEYADEEKAQWEAELQRAKEFDETMAGFSSTFDINVQRREEAFLHAQAKQDEAFRINEEGREAIFSEGQSSRALSFQREQDTRSKRSEWYSAVRDDHFQYGRRTRKVVCDELEKSLVEQFNDLVRAQEDLFTSNEGRRDDTVNKLVEEDMELRRVLPNAESMIGIAGSPHPDLNSVDLPTVNPEHPASIDEGQEPECPPLENYFPIPESADIDTISASQPSPSVGSNNRETPFNDEEEEGFPVQLVPEGFSNGILLPPSPHRELADESAVSNSSPDTQAKQNDGGTQGGSTTKVIIQEPTRYPDVAKVGRGMHDVRFDAAQQERQRIFSREEEERESRFRENETAREGAGAARRERFNLKEQARKARHHAMMVAHKELFDERQAERMIPEVMRHEKHEAAQARRYQLFEQALLVIRHKFAAANSLEDKVMASMTGAVRRLDDKQSTLLWEAREHIQARFEESQHNRDHLLGYTRERMPSSGVLGESRRPPPVEARPAPYPRSRISFHYPHSSPIFQAISPPSGFAATALFRGDPPHAGLPVSRAHQRGHLTPFVHDAERRRQYIFKQSQVQQRRAFENGMQYRRQIFNGNEMRRQLDFEAKQRDRKAIFEDKKGSRESDFQEAQKKREKKFWQDEHKRALTAASAEHKRDDEFQIAQWKREIRFHSEQETLTEKCFEDEDDRRQNFASSEIEFYNRLENRKERETTVFNQDENRREATFQTSVERSPLVLRIKRMRDAQTFSK